MKTRIITAAVMVALMIPFFVYSNTVVFTLLISFLSAVGVCEMQKCIGTEKNIYLMIPAVCFSVAVPFIAKYKVTENMGLAYIFILSFVLITYMLIASVFSRQKLSVEATSMSALTTVYIVFGLSAIIFLREAENGEYIYLLSFIIPWTTDTFAYFGGKAFGKHKLIPEVSPKKTVEGSVSGTVCSMLLTLLYGFIIGKVFNSVVPNYKAIAAITLVVSALSQCGDLIMSLIKRKFGIKDYGKLFPGHGGVLDRFDSIICTAAFLYFFSKIGSNMSIFYSL